MHLGKCQVYVSDSELFVHKATVSAEFLKLGAFQLLLVLYTQLRVEADPDGMQSTVAAITRSPGRTVRVP